MSRTETTQCITDITSWFSRFDVSTKPCSAEDLEPLSKVIGSEVDDTLISLVEECGNGIWYGDKKGMTVDAIVDAVDSGKFGSCLPFASDEDGDFYLVIAEDGSVKEFSDEEEGDVMGGSMNDYLEEYRNGLLGGKFEYVEDCGCMEKAGAGGSHK
jgi:hypothetical protein